MFPIGVELTIIYFALILVGVFVTGVVFAILINLGLRTPPTRHIRSSGSVAVISFSLVQASLIFMPGQLQWFNEEPQNLRSELWDHSLVIAAIVAIACTLIWQLIVRRRSHAE